nr:hypothetical protein [Tanacetum cinerariifolium]
MANDTNPIQPLASTPVVAGMNKEVQQATSGPTSLGVTDSTTEDDSRKSNPKDNKALSNPKHELKRRLAMSQNLTLFLNFTSSDDVTNEIKLEELSKLVKDVNIDTLELDSLEDDQPFIILTGEEEEVHVEPNTETKDTLLKVFDALPSLLNKVTEAMDSPLKTTPQPEGEVKKYKGKKDLSHEEADEEESESDFKTKVRLTNSLVESSKEKFLKKFAYINEQGESFLMTEDEIKTQKKIEQTIKVDVAKAEIKKGKEELIDLLGLEMVERMFKDKGKYKTSVQFDGYLAGTVINEPSLGMIPSNLAQGLGEYDLARTFSSLLVAKVDKRSLNLLKKMRVIEHLRQ